MNRYASDLETRTADVAARKSIRRRRRRISPVGVLLLIAAVGSVAFVLYAISVRDLQQMPLFAAALTALALVFALVTVASGISAVRAGSDCAGGRAVFYALLGGFSAIVASAAFAMAIIIFMLSRG